MLHTDGQLKLAVLRCGPNQRKDYHIEEGEELERLASEMDGLRYFLETADGTPTLRPLFERYVHMRDLGSQVAGSRSLPSTAAPKSSAPDSRQSLRRTMPTQQPLQARASAAAPGHFGRLLLDKHQQELDNAEVKNGSSSLEVFPSQCGYQFLVEVVGRSDGRQEFVEYNCETWLLQLVGECSVTFYVEKGQTATARRLGEKDSLLVPAGVAFGVVQSAGCRLLKASQDPGRKGY
uniref:Cupin_5 domain-containing protein n=1 Tax=Macrostomum lignano TaxID=282301 RepID=A0A1I8GI63_9PLAT